MSLEKLIQIEKMFSDVFCDKALKQNLQSEDYQLYQNEIKSLSFVKGDVVIKEGSNPEGVFVIKSGTIKLYKSGFNQKEQILRFVKEGDLFGYRSLLCGEYFGASAVAMTNLEATFIPTAIFNHLLEVYPQFTFVMLKKIAFELGEASNTITFLAQKTVRERLAEVLLLLEGKLGCNPEGYINISLTREEIANLVGTATESAIRLISEFKTDKLITVEGRLIKILEPAKLKRMAHLTSL